MQLVRGGSGSPDDPANAAFKFIRNAGQDGTSIVNGTRLHLLLLDAEPRRLSQVILEDLEAARNPADLVFSVDEGNIEREVPLGQAIHDLAGLRKRNDHAATEPECGHACDSKP